MPKQPGRPVTPDPLACVEGEVAFKRFDEAVRQIVPPTRPRADAQVTPDARTPPRRSGASRRSAPARA